MFSDEFVFELNDFFEDASLFTFEEDNRTLEDVQLSPPKEFKTLSLILRQ